MAKGFTVAEIDNLKCGPRRRELSDGKQTGLYFIIQPSGARSWAYRYRFGGKSKKFTIGPYPAISLAAARAKAAAASVKVVGEVDPAAEKKAERIAKTVPADDTIATIIKQFVAAHCKRKLKARSAREVERLLTKEIAAPWGERPLSHIGKKDIHALLDAIVERPAPITANRTLAWLHTLFNWAVERGVVNANPCIGIRPPADETARDRVLSDDELAALWRASDGLAQPYSEFIKLLILTGARRNEIAELRWREVDLDAKVWTLPKERAKNAREHTIPLSDLAVEVLKGLPRIDGSDLIFTLNGKNRISAFSLTKDRLNARMPTGTAHWQFHDLRRSLASGCARLGVAVHVVEALLNHKSGSIRGVAAVYNRYSYDTEKRAAAEAWARHVEALVSGEPRGNVVELATARA